MKASAVVLALIVLCAIVARKVGVMDEWKERAVVIPAHVSDGRATPSVEGLRMVERTYDACGKLAAVRSTQGGLIYIEVAYETTDPETLRWPTIEELYDAMRELGVNDRAFQTMFGGVDPALRMREAEPSDDPIRLIVQLVEIPNSRKLYKIPGGK